MTQREGQCVLERITHARKGGARLDKGVRKGIIQEVHKTGQLSHHPVYCPTSIMLRGRVEGVRE